MFVYKVLDTVNGYYHYIVSHIDDEDLVLEHQEHYSAHCPENPINMYFNTVVGWDDVDIQKVEDIKPADIINKNFPADPLNMAISDDYKKLIPPPKPKKEPKQKEPKEPKQPKEPKEPKAKKEPKPRAKKGVVIDTTLDKTKLNVNS